MRNQGFLTQDQQRTLPTNTRARPITTKATNSACSSKVASAINNKVVGEYTGKPIAGRFAIIDYLDREFDSCVMRPMTGMLPFMIMKTPIQVTEFTLED